jgi:hypothetical protein
LRARERRSTRDDEAMTRVAQVAFGDTRFASSPADPKANEIAASKGIHGRRLWAPSSGQRENMHAADPGDPCPPRRSPVAQLVGHGGTPTVTIPEPKFTAAMGAVPTFAA